MRANWKRRLWIVDGHNAIFGIGALSRLQQSDQRAAARRGLEQLLGPFASRLEEPLCIVYDGNRLTPNPDATHTGFLHTIYSQPPEEADDRILFLVTQALAAGRSVTVVTDDRRSLAARLPAEAGVMGLAEFRSRCLTRPEPPDEALPPGHFDDLEEAFLARAGEIEERARRGARGRARRSERLWQTRFGHEVASTGSAAPRPGMEEGEEAGDRRRAAPESGAGAPGERGWRGGAPRRVERPAAHEPVDRGAGAGEDGAQTGDAARGTREAKRLRGERKQRRRLAAMGRRKPPRRGPRR